MALKTFNIDASVYKTYSSYCKEQGISMSKQVEKFMQAEVFRIAGKQGEEKNEKKESNAASHRALEHSMKKFC